MPTSVVLIQGLLYASYHKDSRPGDSVFCIGTAADGCNCNSEYHEGSSFVHFYFLAVVLKPIRRSLV